MKPVALVRGAAGPVGLTTLTTHITFRAETGLGVCAEYCRCGSTMLVSSFQQKIGKQHACV
jgi:hypothetical protein